MHCLFVMNKDIFYFRQGVSKGSKHKSAKAKTCRSVPKDLLDANDLECSLCMRSVPTRGPHTPHTHRLSIGQLLITSH